MGYSFLKTIKKAAISTGTFVGISAVLGAAAALQNEVVLAGIWAETGPIALIAIPALVFGGRTLEDWVKHRKQGR